MSTNQVDGRTINTMTYLEDTSAEYKVVRRNHYCCHDQMHLMLHALHNGTY